MGSVWASLGDAGVVAEMLVVAEVTAAAVEVVVEVAEELIAQLGSARSFPTIPAPP